MNQSLIGLLSIDFLSKGGVLMAPLAVCSLISIAVIVERFVWGPRRSRVIPADFVRDVGSLLSKSRIQEAQGLCRAKSSPIARIFFAVLQSPDAKKDDMIDAATRAGRRETVKLQKNISVLSTIGAISPLLGLLGTVLGMITTFQVIGNAGIGNAEALAGGISEALISTATGLTIAIPSFVFYRYFIQKVKNLVVDMEEQTAQLVQLLSEQTETEDSELKKVSFSPGSRS